MTADQLRAQAAEFRATAAKASAEHVRLARALREAEGAEAKAVDIRAGVADCMARRYRQWADQLDLAALELDS